MMSRCLAMPAITLLPAELGFSSGRTCLTQRRHGEICCCRQRNTPVVDSEFQLSGDRMPEPVRVEILPNRSVTALFYPTAAQDRAEVTLILAPGAGAGHTSAFIVNFATGLA